MKKSKDYWLTKGSLKSSFALLDVKAFSERSEHYHLLPSNVFADGVEFPEGNIKVEMIENFSYEEVRESLRTFKSGKSAGQDNIYP